MSVAATVQLLLLTLLFPLLLLAAAPSSGLVSPFCFYPFRQILGLNLFRQFTARCFANMLMRKMAKAAPAYACRHARSHHQAKRHLSNKRPRVRDWGARPLPLSPVAESMPRSGIRDVMDHAWGLERNGAEVFHLEVGQPMFESPPKALHTVADSVMSKHNQGYIANAGLPELRSIILEYYKQRLGEDACGLSARNICTSHGCVGALTTAFLATINPGDEVLIANPAWPNYEMAVKLYGGTPVYYDLKENDGWKIDFDQLRTRISKKTKMIVICTPSNPTGAVLTLDELERLSEICNEHDIFLLSDEIYSQIYFGNKCNGRLESNSILECANMNPDRTIVVSGVSKAYSMTGFRVGWLVANEDIIDTSIKLQEAFLSCSVPVSQLAAKTAIEMSLDGTDGGYVENCVNEYNNRRTLALNILQKYGLRMYDPLGAFYVLVPIKEWVDRRQLEHMSDSPSVAFCKELLDTKHVAVSPGDTFGSNTDRYIRVSLASDARTVKVGVERVCEFIKSG